MSPAASTHTLGGLPHGVAVWACLAAVACASAGGGPATTPGQPSADAETAEAERTSDAYTDADVAFMRGMIHHHAQAVTMARLAPDRAASPALRRLAARILNSQETEISIMADWLRDREEPVPEIASAAVAAAQKAPGEGTVGEIAPPGGWDAGMQMPGLLSDAKMARLRDAEREAFDRLFLTYMIEHHQGAVTMVDNLVDSPNGAREESVFRLASGIRSDQSMEIDRMRTMLRDSFFADDSP